MKNINKDIIRRYLNRVLSSSEIEDKFRYLNFRCPFCGDSKKSKKKKRGNINLQADIPYFKCFNCDINLNIYDFFKELNYDVYVAFKKDIFFNNTTGGQINEPPQIIQKTNNNKVEEFLEYIKKYKIKKFIKPKNYLVGRGIELNKYILNNLYYSDELDYIFKKFFPEKSVIFGSGIFIPTYDLKKNINGFQIRILDSKINFRYVTLKLYPGETMIFNLPNLRPNEHLYINEGFFDGQFLDNSLNTNLSGIPILANKIASLKNKNDITIVLDNERSKEIIKIMNNLIADRFNIFIWPESKNNCNDINDLYLKYFVNKKEELLEFINNNTFNTIKAKMKLNIWRQNG